MMMRRTKKEARYDNNNACGVKREKGGLSHTVMA